MGQKDIQKGVFKARVRNWADKLDVKVNWLGVRPMRAHLGSYEAMEAELSQHG